MGARGPVPKRSSERRRRNADSKPDIVQPLIAAVVDAPPAKATWHPIAKDWYESLKESGQAQFYEPSDWQVARYIAEAMSVNLRQGKKFSAMLFAAVQSGMTDLLTTEGARRRARLEIERNPVEGEPAGVTAIADYKRRIKTG